MNVWVKEEGIIVQKMQTVSIILKALIVNVKMVLLEMVSFHVMVCFFLSFLFFLSFFFHFLVNKKKISTNVQTIMVGAHQRQHVQILKEVLHVNVKVVIMEMVSLVMVRTSFFSPLNNN